MANEPANSEAQMPTLKSRPKLFAIGPAMDQSSYARVLHGILLCLASDWDIVQFAVNYRGEAHVCEEGKGWSVLPNRNIGDRFGIAQAPDLIARFTPDLVFILNCFTVLPRYCNVLAQLDSGGRRPKFVAYSPLLGEPVDAKRVKGLAFYDALVAVTPGVRQYFHDALSRLQHAGEITHLPQIAAIPHGFDSARFHQLAVDSSQARHAAKKLVFPEFAGDDDFADSFIVLNANRNEARKCIATTIAGFARFARDKPAGVRLHLHMGECSDQPSLQSLIQSLGIAERVTLASAQAGMHPKISDAALNLLYNACDVGINTSASEGFGMISFEHAATGAAQIVPGHGVCLELWQGEDGIADAEILPAFEAAQIDHRSIVKEKRVAGEDVAAALGRLYAHRTSLSCVARRSQRNALRPQYQWQTSAGLWNRLFLELLASIV